MRTQAGEGVPGAGADHDSDTGARWFGLWDGYFAISYLVTTILLFVSAGEQVHRAVAIGLVTLVIPWYAALGRDLMIHDTAGRRNIVFALVLTVLFAAATTFDLAAAFGMFAVVPMLIMSLPMARAIVLVLVANLWPVAVVRVAGGDQVRMLHVLPISLLSIALSIFLGLWITRVVRQSKERGALIEELQSSREREARLSRDAGVAAERERLAREIHDTITQGLTSIVSLVQAADAEVNDSPGLARERLALADRVAKESLAEARDFIAALTPPTLRGSSLAQAVRRQAEGLEAQTGLEVRCSVHGEERPLPMAVSVVLLRAVQEAVANVRKHATEAGRVTVTVRYDEDTVRLRVEDDGQGFVPDGLQEGYGLRGMLARVREISGRAEIRSHPGQGTTIDVAVPLRATDSEAAAHG
ncbi:sensor histidine kinase [Streptomyces sp. NPDC006923]|uniref:sensor histidine kinase n=1 Tax=Streptomyces sp. NPDC006923 TaxID=3155355 RepID=UPI0033E8B777